MKYYQLQCQVYLKEDISFKDSFDFISRYISFSMAQDDVLQNIHNKRGFKYYTFSSFTPIQRDGVYKKGESYQFNINSIDKDFIDKISQLLRQNIDNSYMIVVSVYKKVINQFFISELYSLTPVIVSVSKNTFWTMQKDGDILTLQKQLQSNLEKKYKNFYNEELKISQNFIQLLEIKNKVPQNIVFMKEKKSIRLFGNKFRIIPNEDETSQRLAFLALGAGLGEKGSFGGGFCTARRLG
jgi:CRISPR-associated endoribonuclease Cas6